MRMLRFGGLVSLFVMMTVPAWAATYYIAPTGNDTTGTGAIGAPWLTLGKANSVVVAGDTVNLRAGTYGGTAAYVTLSTSGTAALRITYQSYPGEAAVIDGSAHAQGTGFQLLTVNGDYITLKNLEIKNASNMSILVGNGADNNIFDTLTIHDGYRNGIGLYRNHFNTVTNSHIYNLYDFNTGGGNADCIDTVDDGPGTEGGNHTITNNTVHGCSDDGIDMWRAANNTITGNLSYHNGYIGSTSTPVGNGNGYKLGPGGSNTVIDNIAYDNRIRGFDANSGPNNLVYNNTAISNNTYNYSFAPSGSILTNNIAYLGGTNVLTGATQTTNSWQLGISNPQFVQSNDPTTPTTFARLSAGSPAINVGTTVAGSTHVCIGVCDLGRWEFSAGVTYYVDFAGGLDTNNGTAKTGVAPNGPWKHAKGMVGATNLAASTPINDGDIIVFKGGVTWTASFPWVPPFGTASMITYTTDHTWFNGASWSRPVMDDQARMVAYNAATGGIVRITNGKFLTFNDIEWANAGAANDAGRTTFTAGIYIINGHDLTFTNNRFRTFSWLNIYISLTASGDHSNYIFTDNDTSDTSVMARIGTFGTDIRVHNVQILRNTMHDVSSMLGGLASSTSDGFHGDGFLHYYSIKAPGGAGTTGLDPTQWLDGLVVANNRTYGDWRDVIDPIVKTANTSMIYFEGAVSGIVCNNDFSFSPAEISQFNGIIYFDFYGNTHPGTLYIVNNTMLQPEGANSMSGGLRIRNQPSSTTLIIRNNIIANMQYAVFHDVATQPLNEDYNLLESTGGLLGYSPTTSLVTYTYANWRNNNGWDTHSVFGSDPLVIAVHTNNRLQAGSPAINAGENLTSLGFTVLNSDKDGNPRPATGPWTMGAYNLGATDTQAPAAPTNVTVQ